MRPTMPSSLHRPAISAIASLVVGLGLSACGDDMIVDSATASASESGSASGGLTTSGTSGSTGGTSESESGSGSASAGACTPGEETSCTCPEGQGTQVCKGDGSGWGGCECPGIPSCGDGVVEGDEECDEGAANADDAGCTSDCKVAICGDGLVHEGVEACDDGTNDGGYNGCERGCAARGPFCGDAMTNGPEACDDGNAVQGDGCNIDCLVSGSEVWTVNYNGRDAGDAIAHGVAVDGDGNVIVVGEQFVVGEGANIWIAKYTAEGDQLWTKTYIGEGTLADVARGVAVDPQGDYVVVGQLAVKGEDTNFWVAKLDPAGNELWSDIYNGPSDLGDSARGVAVDSDGNIWAVGDEYKLIGLANIVVRKYDPAGTLLFSDVYDHKAGIDRAHGVAILSDDSAVVVGEIYEPIGLADLWIRRYTAAGSELWTKSWDNKAGNDIIRAVAVDGEDHIFAVGEVYEPIGLANIWIRKLSDTGVEAWTQTYDSKGSDNDIGRGVAVAPDGTVVVAGQEYTANDFAGIWVRKLTNMDGAELWTHTYDGPGAGQDIARAVAINGDDGYIYGAGQEYMAGQFATLWLRKINP